MLAPPGQLAPPPWGNPGSATELFIKQSKLIALSATGKNLHFQQVIGYFSQLKTQEDFKFT